MAIQSKSTKKEPKKHQGYAGVIFSMKRDAVLKILRTEIESEKFSKLFLNDGTWARIIMCVYGTEEMADYKADEVEVNSFLEKLADKIMAA